MIPRSVQVLYLLGARLLLQAPCISSSTPENWCQETANGESAMTYDYIVVGAGAGGGVVAARLAQAGFETLLLDAGPDYNDWKTEVPLLWPFAATDTDFEWAFRTKNTDLPGRDNVLYPRGTLIGGSTMVNNMLSTYPFPDFFDGIAQVTGDKGFEEERMRQRFQRIENNEYCNEGAKGHGFSGWLSTSLTDLRLLLWPQLLDLHLIRMLSQIALNTLPSNPGV